MKDDFNQKPIPEEFYSFESKAPFSNCLECDKYLLDGEPYVIEKAVRNYKGFEASDTIFDYALCMSCLDDLKSRMSEESSARIQSFFEQRISESIHPSQFLGSTGSCLITGKSKDDCEEYQIYAFCNGRNLSQEIPPYMISGEVIDEILPLLSKTTKDDLDGFFNKHFAPDPTLMEPIGPKLIPF